MVIILDMKRMWKTEQNEKKLTSNIERWQWQCTAHLHMLLYPNVMHDGNPLHEMDMWNRTKKNKINFGLVVVDTRVLPEYIETYIT